MRILFPLIALTALAGCANQQYAGVNYGEVTTPSGEHWIIAGGKDETNVNFEVTRPDGTTASYHADNADASSALKAALEGNAAIMTQMQNTLNLLIAKGLPLPLPVAP